MLHDSQKTVSMIVSVPENGPQVIGRDPQVTLVAPHRPFRIHRVLLVSARFNLWHVVVNAWFFVELFFPGGSQMNWLLVPAIRRALAGLSFD